MLFDPPPLSNIKEMLPYIEGKPGFSVKEKGFYTVIDYHFMSDDMFQNSMERECRGLKFDTATGRLIARPYHKFHNLNERPAFATDKVNLLNPHVILEKLDGSMVHTCPSPLGIYLMTRAGITEVAKQAEKVMLANQIKFSQLFNALSVDEYTFIFEYIGPSNKIVLDYPKEELVLTAIRNVNNGTYIFHEELTALGMSFGIPVVGEAVDAEFKDKLTIHDINESTKLASGCEGVVVRFDTGEMVKIKADEYCRKHHSKELVSSQKRILELILTNTLDDVIPQLEEPHLSKVKSYNSDILDEVQRLAFDLDEFVGVYVGRDRKYFAIDVQKEPKAYQSILFRIWDGDNPREAVINQMLKNIKTNSHATSYLESLNMPVWTFSFFAEE